MFELSNRVCLVTGGAQGIGRAISLALAQLGARVVVSDLNFDGAEGTARLAQGAGAAAAIGLRHDVTDEAHWQDVLRYIQREWGRLDALINNAGIMIPAPLVHATLDEFHKSIEINSASVFMGSRQAAPLLIETAKVFSAKPSIVNLSSIYGAFAGPAHVTYSASKGAVRAMGKAMAFELAKYGIRVNTVFPGPVNTELVMNAVKTLAGYGLRKEGDAGIAAIAQAHPMGRMAEPEDIAGVVAFLCSDASSFMTGGELFVDGGWTLS
jgi:NAD(P)-dependent dehydrogenase (short-subunit alcohol dehydrogenase family)